MDPHETVHLIGLAELQALIRGNVITVGPVTIVLDPRELDRALEAMDALAPMFPEASSYRDAGIDALRDAGINLEKGGPDGVSPG